MEYICDLALYFSDQLAAVENIRSFPYMVLQGSNLQVSFYSIFVAYTKICKC